MASTQCGEKATLDRAPPTDASTNAVFFACNGNEAFIGASIGSARKHLTLHRRTPVRRMFSQGYWRMHSTSDVRGHARRHASNPRRGQTLSYCLSVVCLDVCRLDIDAREAEQRTPAPQEPRRHRWSNNSGRYKKDGVGSSSGSHRAWAAESHIRLCIDMAEPSSKHRNQPVGLSSR